MSATFTPGPWKVHCEGWPLVGPEDGFQPFGGCGCCGSPWIQGGTDNEQMANARLIAAAPDLLEVTQAFRQKLSTYVHAFTGDTELRKLLAKCDAAIEKARGEE